MRRSLVVARREFISTVRRKGYLVATIGMPAFLVLYGLLVSVPALLSARHERQTRTIGVVVQSPGLALPDSLVVSPASLPPGSMQPDVPMQRNTTPRAAESPVRFRAYPDTGAARKSLLAGDIVSFYVLPDSYVTTGAVSRFTAGNSPISDNEVERRAVDGLLRRALLAGRVDSATLGRTLAPYGSSGRVRAFESSPAGGFVEQSRYGHMARIIVPLVFGILLMLSIFVSSGMLLHGVVEEKENRVMEILLSSVTPLELFLGKLFGLGAAGFLQLAIWLATALVISVGALPFLVSAGVAAHVPVHVWIVCFLFFIAGFLQYGSLMVGFGSLGNNVRESQQIGMIWTWTSIIPLIMLPNLLEEPNGVLARVLSFVPLTAPITMMVRLGATAVPPWEVAASLAVVLAGAALSLKVTAKLFRIGVLLYGKRPTFVEILRWARA